MEHSFTEKIRNILNKNFKSNAIEIFEKIYLIKYINEKTRSADKGFSIKGDYSQYEGAIFQKLLLRQRELPFGSKSQNHALNNRMNSEFKKFFPENEFIPILRKLDTNRYWINENLLKIYIGKKL